MDYFIIIGLVMALILTILYVAVDSKNTEQEIGISWKNCFRYGAQIYFLSLFLGSLATSLVQNAQEQGLLNFFKSVLINSFGLFFNAVFFTFFIVLPALTIGFRYISKMSFSIVKKKILFVVLNIALVVVINVIMSALFHGVLFLKLLSGFSFFGIAIPHIFMLKKKLFSE